MRTRGKRTRGHFAGSLLAIAVVVLLGGMFAGKASAAPPQALILASSVTGGALSHEGARATADGFTGPLATDPQWLAMSGSDFAAYQLIIVGDPTCSSTSPVVSQNATNLASAVMGTAPGGSTKAGNRILM